MGGAGPDASPAGSRRQPMKRSTERILSTHVGSLARPDALVPILKAKDRSEPYDGEAYTRLVREAVADVVRRQAEAGIDIVTDGEQGKASFFGYIVERFNGFARKPAPRRAGGQPPRREPRVPGVSRLLRVVRAHRGVGGRPGRRPRPRDRRVYRAGQLQGPGGGPGRHRESEIGAQGPAPRRRLHAGHRAVLHLRHARRTSSTAPTRNTSRRSPTRSARSTGRSSTRASCSRSTIRGWSPTT